MQPRLFAAFAVAALASGAPQNGVVASHLPRPVRAMSSKVRPAEIALVGTIEKFEAAGRRLVLRTREGRHVEFVVGEHATLRVGSHPLTAAELAKHNGGRAKIRFTEIDGTRTAHWVMISSDVPKKGK
jgi:hypothetical protein